VRVPTETAAVPTPAHHAGFPQGFTQQICDWHDLRSTELSKNGLDHNPDGTGRSDLPKNWDVTPADNIRSDASAEGSLWLSITEPVGRSSCVVIIIGDKGNHTTGSA
jgi:hypothetical protein